MTEYGYDTYNMKVFADESMQFEIPIESVPREQIEKVLGGIPIIRCKDCRHYSKNSGLHETNCFMANWFKRYQHDDDYCSRAERKEE